MNLTRAKQAENLFHQALECAVAEREAFLLKACDGDAELYAEVCSLLAAHEDGIIPSIPILELLTEGDEGPDRTLADTLVFDDPLNTDRTEANDSDPELFSLAEGTILAGRYRLEREVGRGGFSQVFLARDQKLQGAKVVIKVLLKSGQGGLHSFWVERKFRDEIAALARINHPGVIRALDVGELPDGRLWLAMQYVSGVTLREVLPSHGMEFKQVAELMRQIGNALAAAHSQGVIHRDLKPENIMLEKAGAEDHVRLIDFGIASITDATSGATTTIPAGTLNYAAPEQLLGRSSVASDIYALGVVAYEMITGRCPFMLGGDRAEVRVAPSSLRPELPPQAEDVILKALSFEPQERYQSAADFTKALFRALTDDSIGAKGAKPARKRSRRWQLSQLVGAVAIIIGAAIIWWKLQSTPPPPALPERMLSYSLTVQRDPKRYPQSQPFSLPGEILLGPGDMVRLQLSSPQGGYLYVLNETPRSTSAQPKFRVLFPYAITGEASARVTAWQPVPIPYASKDPEDDWFVLEEQTGAEKIWLVLAESELPVLEGVKHLANPDDLGVVKDAAANRSIATLLAEQAAKGKIESRGGEKATLLRCACGVLVGLVKLEHR